jgi:hypothetical protein
MLLIIWHMLAISRLIRDQKSAVAAPSDGPHPSVESRREENVAFSHARMDPLHSSLLLAGIFAVSACELAAAGWLA